MRGPKAALVCLSKEEREELEKLIRRHSTPQQIALRGRIVLAAAERNYRAHFSKACLSTLKKGDLKPPLIR